MAGKIEIRKSGEKFRFVVLNRNGEKLLQSGQFDDKPSTKTRSASTTASSAVSEGAASSSSSVPTRRANVSRCSRVGLKIWTPVSGRTAAIAQSCVQAWTPLPMIPTLEASA
jgi:hypothetical protein